MSDVHILERIPDSTSRQEEATSPRPHPPLQPILRYVHFSSDRIEALFQEVCHLLGCHGSLAVIVDYLLDQLKLSSSLHGKELLLVLSRVLVGAGQRRGSAESADEMYALVEGILEEVVAPSNWNKSHDAVVSFWEEEKSDNTKVKIQ